MRTKLPNAAECVVLGFLAGVTAGVLSGHLIGAVALGALAGPILGLLRVALGIVYDAASRGPH